MPIRPVVPFARSNTIPSNSTVGRIHLATVAAEDPKTIFNLPSSSGWLRCCQCEHLNCPHESGGDWRGKQLYIRLTFQSQPPLWGDSYPPAVSDQNEVERKSGEISKPQSQNLTERSHSMLMLSSVRAFRVILVQPPPLRWGGRGGTSGWCPCRGKKRKLPYWCLSWSLDMN